eukprot:CAMPEP_0119298672 /NCGR_PEP_ID=MMETSP1333-20130426/836_1 /TAXON_ID=418940 /ORGANISM="Scyphosphaera apsteinii, Strain RCC1455" /LENGTH=309 /DNA_ID=CAMNT_0007299843 /DNA_START=77 /DNA_END=1006 /DNA_ORIENTATION=+
MRDNKQLGMALSLLLRHSAMKDNVQITPDGWVLVSDVLRWVHKRRGLSTDADTIKYLVETNDKQRFSLQGSGASLAMRANQGHSMEGIRVGMQGVPDDIKLAVHGTYYRAWSSIREGGLSRMARQHIHLAVDLPNGSSVISGMRKSCELLVWVDLRKARLAGIHFLLSSNGVILTEGLAGVISPQYFERVVDRATGKIVWPNLTDVNASLEHIGVKNSVDSVMPAAPAACEASATPASARPGSSVGIPASDGRPGSSAGADKHVQKLQKKLHEIDKLLKRQEAGEVLQLNQLKKIEHRDELLSQLPAQT